MGEDLTVAESLAESLALEDPEDLAPDGLEDFLDMFLEAQGGLEEDVPVLELITALRAIEEDEESGRAREHRENARDWKALFEASSFTTILAA